MQKFRWPTSFAWATAVAVVLPAVTMLAVERPNVLLIVSEDNGPELSCYGDPHVRTPRLDRLAAEGVRFERAFVPYSVCSPSRACYLPGLSLVPLLRGEQAPWREHIFGVTIGGAPSLYYPQQSVRDDRYKLILSPVWGRTNAPALAYLEQRNAHFVAGTKQEEINASPEFVQVAYARYLKPPEVELYDLQSDPYEWHDLAEDRKFAPHRERLMQAFRQWQDDVRDPLADAVLLQRFTAEHDRAMTIGYRKDVTFRWAYLDYFRDFMNR